MSNIEIYRHNEFGEIRTVLDEQQNVWFCLADVCKGLGLTNPTKVKSSLPKKCSKQVDLAALTNSAGLKINELGNTMANFINEPGLYRCIFQSRKESAAAFQDWIFDEVIPSIRKHGGYIVGQETETPEQLIARALEVADSILAKKERRIVGQRKIIVKQEAEIDNLTNAVIAQNKKIKENTPKVEFADAIVGGKTSCLISELAKILTQNGYVIGQNRLFKKLREEGYLGSYGEYRNVPTQKYVELGIFEIKKGTYTDNRGTNHTTTTTKVTGKGLMYFINRFLKKSKNNKNESNTPDSGRQAAHKSK